MTVAAGTLIRDREAGENDRRVRKQLSMIHDELQ